MPLRIMPVLSLVALAAVALLPALASTAPGFHSVYSVDGTDVWAVGDSGAYYRSFDGGVSWGFGYVGNKTLRAIAARGIGVTCAGDSGKVWHSSNNGGSWALTVISGAPALRAMAFPSDLVGYLVGAAGTILKSVDGGSTWSPQVSTTGATLNAVRFTDDLNGWAVGGGGTALRTSNGGALWEPVSVNATADLFGVDANGSTVWVVGADGTARSSLNGGESWEMVNLKLDARSDVRAVWLKTPTHVVLAGGGGFIRRSFDGGYNWDFPKHQMQGTISALHFTGSRGWACSDRNRAILTSVNGDSSWTLPIGTFIGRLWQQKLSVSASVRGSSISMNPVHKSTLYAALGATVYRSRDDGDTWSTIGTIPQCSKTNAFLVSPRDSNVMVAAVSGVVARRLVKSDDGGQTWFTTLTHEFGEYGIPLEIDPDRPDTMYFGGENDGLFRSTDGGKNWNEIGNVQFRSPCDLVAVPDAPGVILVGDGITGSGQADYFKSIDGGEHFTLSETRPTGSSEIPGMACGRLRNSVTFGTNWGSGGVQRSEDFGDSWPTVNFTTSAWGVDVARDDPNVVIFGVYSGGVTYLSFDGGSTFVTTSLGNSNYSFFARDRGTLLAEQSNGIWKMAINYAYTPNNNQLLTVTSPNGGEDWRANTVRTVTWTSQNIGLARIEYRRSPSDPWQLVAEVPGHRNSCLWTVPDDVTSQAEIRVQDAWDTSPVDQSNSSFTISGATVAVGDRSGVDFALSQNQPNPFTRSTRIRYALPVSARVDLEVFDLTGQRVATLVRGVQAPGEHVVDFGSGATTASGERVGALPAGVYFYRFQSGSFERTRKMLVLN